MKLVGYMSKGDAEFIQNKPRHNGTASAVFYFKEAPTETATMPFYIGDLTFYEIKAAVAKLTSAQRCEIFGAYCGGCNGPLPCNCWRDD